ncbi:MAG TPA: OmpA family protein [Blastocatellia bacterium]|nr:OmpA family protein [Blastocatellia bacterium]
MLIRLVTVALVLVSFVFVETGCATKKYVRNRIAERVEPLENRTTELEETSRRNTQQISELRSGIEDVRMRADKAQATADRAASSAEQANTRLTTIETSVEDLRANLDKYTVQNRAMVFFRPGSAKLTPEAMAQLDTLASQITDRSGFVLEITGFGDTEKVTRYNQNLAQLRAEAVQRYLADKHNIPVMRTFALGLGAARPISQDFYAQGGQPTDPQATQTTPTTTTPTAVSRAQFRRVEIRLLTNNAVPGAPMRTTTGSPSKTTSSSME